MTYVDGTRDEYSPIDGTFSESHNARKKYGFSNSQTWTEYFISWVIYDEDRPPTVVPSEPVEKRSHGKEEIWCSPHDCPPSECFASLHNPTAFSGREPNWKEEVIQAGKPGLMKAYGLTSESLERWFELEDRAKQPIMEEFDISDLLGGYGNGSVHT